MEQPMIPQNVVEGASKCSTAVEKSIEGFHKMYRESISKAETDCEELHIYQSYVRDLSGLLRNCIRNFSRNMNQVVTYYEEQAKTQQDLMSIGDLSVEQRARMVELMRKFGLSPGDGDEDTSNESLLEIERLQAEIGEMRAQMSATQQELDASKLSLLEVQKKLPASKEASDEVKILKGQVEDLKLEIEEMRKGPAELFAMNYEEIKPLPFDESGSGDATSGDVDECADKIEAPKKIDEKLQAKLELNDRKVQAMKKQMKANKVQTEKVSGSNAKQNARFVGSKAKK